MFIIWTKFEMRYKMGRKVEIWDGWLLKCIHTHITHFKAFRYVYTKNAIRLWYMSLVWECKILMASFSRYVYALLNLYSVKCNHCCQSVCVNRSKRNLQKYICNNIVRDICINFANSIVQFIFTRLERKYCRRSM